MKGYTIGTTMYVFDATPGQFPSVEATTTVIYVQEEALAAWKEANSEYATIIKPYNFNTITVQKPVWYDYIDEDIPNKQPTTYTISYQGIEYVVDAVQVAEPDETVSINLIEQEGSYTVEVYYYDNDDPETGVAVYLELYQADTYTYQFAMPAHPTYATITYEAPAQSYSITYDGSEYIVDAPNEATAGETVTLTLQELQPEGSAYAVDAGYYDNDDPETGNWVIAAGPDSIQTTTWTFTMPAHPTYVSVYYNAPNFTITKSGTLAEQIDTPQDAKEGDEVNVMLMNPETYTFDKTSQTKSIIEIEVDGALPTYDAVNDQYSFTMPGSNTTVHAKPYVTYALTITDALTAISNVWDNNENAQIDPSAVPGGHQLQVNLNSGFTFDKEAQEGTIVVAELNGVEIEYGEGHYRSFTMPSENSTLTVTQYVPL